MLEKPTRAIVDRRSFLRGSAVFAAALGLAVTPSYAAQQPPPKKEEPEPSDPFADEEEKDEKKLVDEEGREYRVCPQCAYNMYKQGRMWVCENCGYSYVE
jgi:TAT (twin-arginine translocation) pathway signal sequence